MTEVLYVLVRNDLDSMNPGKAMAQTGHAGSAFTHAYMFVPMLNENDPDDDVHNWHQQSKQGFGTKLTLAVTAEQLGTAVMLAARLGYKADIIVDDTYPYIVTNEVAQLISVEVDAAPRHPVSDTHMALYRSEDTVGYVFVPNKEEDEVAAALLGNFKLHP